MTARLDVTDVAKLVRTDIAAAIRSDTLPKIRVTVRIDRYSQGQSVRIRVTSVPADFVIPNLARLQWELEHPHDCAANAPEASQSLLSPRAKRLRDQVESLLGRYNREGETNDRQWFHADVDFDGKLVSEQRAVCRYVLRGG